jgi:hypothetical protein
MLFFRPHLPERSEAPRRIPIPTELDALAAQPEDPYQRFPESESGGHELQSSSQPGPAPADPGRPEHG